MMKLSMISFCIIWGIFKLTQAEESPSLESLKPGAFSNEKAVDFFFKKKGRIIQSLDVLSSSYIQNFNGSDDTWLVAFTLFYYSTTAQYDDKPALIMTLADLFCDDVPLSKRSNDTTAIITAATDYMRRIYGYGGELWTKVTHGDYMKASNPRWPRLDSPDRDTADYPVTIENLIEACAFSFKDPKEWVVRKIRSGLWSIVYAFASNSVISSKEFKEMVETVTKRDRRLEVDNELIDLARDNLLPVISSERLHNIIEYSMPPPAGRAVIQSITDTYWLFRDKIRILILALKEYPDFPWKRVYRTDGLLNNLRSLCAKTYFNPLEGLSVSIANYYYAVAKELFIRIGGHSREKYESWSNEIHKSDEDLIVEYMNGTLRDDPITSEDYFFAVLDCIVL